MPIYSKHHEGRHAGYDMYDTWFAGYVLITLKNGTIKETRSRLMELTGVKLVHCLLGADEIICYIEAEGYSAFLDLLDNKIRQLVTDQWIAGTETLLVLSNKAKGYSGRENKPASISAWCLISVDNNSPEVVSKQLMDLDGVVNAHPVLGRFDVVAYFEVSRIPELIDLIDVALPKVGNITGTDTRLVIMDSEISKVDRNIISQNEIGTG